MSSSKWEGSRARSTRFRRRSSRGEYVVLAISVEVTGDIARCLIPNPRRGQLCGLGLDLNAAGTNEGESSPSWVYRQHASMRSL